MIAKEHTDRFSGEKVILYLPETAKEIAESLIENAFVMGSPRWLNMSCNKEVKEQQKKHWSIHGRDIVKDRLIKWQKNQILDMEIHIISCYTYNPRIEFQREILSELEKINYEK